MKGLFAYGGCVTRDCYEFLKTEYQLVDYVARQSLISSATLPIRVTNAEVCLPSKFQERQLRGDAASSFFTKLSESSLKSEAIIMDLIVERLGVRSKKGGFLTRSNELTKSSLGKAMTSENRTVRFATKRHLDLWKDSARKLVKLLDKEGTLDRVVVFDTPWASKTRRGLDVPYYRAQSSQKMNELYEPYYAHLRALGVRVERFPDELVLADDEHKWGIAPYHYVPEAYEWMAELIRGVNPTVDREKDLNSSAMAEDLCQDAVTEVISPATSKLLGENQP